MTTENRVDGLGTERRTYNNRTRAPWNPVIHNTLKAIDTHVMAHLSSGDPWHEQQAELLRQYVHGLKTWIAEEEKRAKV